MFATQPLAIAQTIMGRPVTNVPLYAVFGVDRLVEEPLIEYYGYLQGMSEGTDGFDSRCDSDAMVGQTSITITPMKIEPIHNEGIVVDNRDDVYGMVGALIYRGEGLNWGGDVAALHWERMAFFASRQHRFTCGDLGWLYKTGLKKILLEGEVVHIGGTRAITLDGAYDRQVRWQTRTKTGYLGVCRPIGSADPSRLGHGTWICQWRCGCGQEFSVPFMRLQRGFVAV